MLFAMNNLAHRILNKLLVLISLIAATNIFGQPEISSKNTKPKLIRGDVFIIEKTANILPGDFTKLAPITTIYVSEINVADQPWNNGFPDLPEIFEWFAIEYKADFRIKQDGNYKFRVFSDDGSKLYVDKKLVADNDGVHQFLPVSGSVKLAKGDHNLTLQFFQGPRYQAGIQLFVKKDGSNEAIFPGSDIELLDGNNENLSAKP